MLLCTLAAIARQTLRNAAACESFRTLDMLKRLKYFVNVQGLKVDRVGPIISPLAHPLGGILAL
jgi:hypothetical protein